MMRLGRLPEKTSMGFVVPGKRRSFIALGGECWDQSNCRAVGVLVSSVRIALLCLLLAHAAVPPRPLAAVAGATVVVIAIFCEYTIRKGFWPAAMALLMLSHFCYGYLWNFVGLAAVITVALDPRWRPRRTGRMKTDGAANALLLVLFANNLLGWVVKNEAPLGSRLAGALIFCGFVAVFLQLSREPMTTSRVHTFLGITGLMAAWLVAVGILQRLRLNTIPSPMLGYYDERAITQTRGSIASFSLFDHTELYGEYAALVFVLFIPFWIFRLRAMGATAKWAAAIPLISVGNMFLSSARSAFVISAVGIALYAVIFMRDLRRVSVAWSRILVLGALSVSAMLCVGGLFGVEGVVRKFQEGKPAGSITVAGLISGEDINRGRPFEIGWRRLREGSWWLGYGSGLYQSNVLAWTGSPTGTVAASGRSDRYADLHNLYFQAIMLYGWSGAAAFFGLILLPLVRIWRARMAAGHEILRALGTALAICWLLFLVDEWKIAALRSENYQLIMWIWLALTHSVSRSLMAVPIKQMAMKCTNC